MPLTYAHYRFGQKCKEKLPEDLKNIINRNIDIYNYGCQGEDIFYFKDINNNEKLKNYGELLHELSFETILKKFKNNIIKIKKRDAALSYILGFISHFLLDSYCNTFINKASKYSNIKETIILKEIEKYFYIKDDLYSKKFNLSSIFKPSKEIVETIMYLHDNFKESIYKEIIYDYKTKLYLMSDSGIIKHNALLTFAKLTSNNDLKEKLSTDKFKECFPYCIRCDKYLEIAAFHYPILIKNFMDYLIKDDTLCNYFNNTSSIKENDSNIPIYNTKEEEKYIIYSLQD